MAPEPALTRRGHWREVLVQIRIKRALGGMVNSVLGVVVGVAFLAPISP